MRGRRIDLRFGLGRLLVLGFTVFASGAQVYAQTPLSEPTGATPGAIASLLDPIVRIRGGTIGVAVYSVDSGRLLYERDADRPLVPASNQKLYTTAAALDRLGPDYQFTTSLYTNGALGPDGVLRGDLILVGRGDPAISGRFYGDSITYVFDRFARDLRRSGVRRVAGRVIGDASYFDDERIAVGWEENNLLWWYGARISALSFNDNVMTIEIQPGARAGESPKIETIPAVDDLPIVNRVRTVGRRGGRSIGIRRRPDLGGYEVWGRIPRGGRPVRYVVSVEEPARFATTVFRDRLVRAGVAIDGGLEVVYGRDGAIRRPWRLLDSHTSPELEELVWVVNKRSQNFFSEQILKTLGAVFEGRGSFTGGRSVVRSVLAEMGLVPPGLVIEDGSGLSRSNRTTARATARLLVAMRDHPRFDEFYDSLLIAGEDGDPDRLDAPRAIGNVRTKTGTLRGVSALSGYVTTRGGELIAFSVISNRLARGKAQAIRIEDGVAEALANFAWWESLPAARAARR